MFAASKRISLICGAILVSGLPLLSQAVPPGSQSTQTALRELATAESDSSIRTTYVLGPQDQIVIHAPNAPDISEKPLRVGLNGEITIPMVGRIQAAGLTTEQFEAELTKHLKVYLEEPDVAVTVMEFHSQPVSVIGAVGTPGVHQLEGRKTLVEILSMAGGVRLDAGPSIRITRQLEWGRIPLPGAADDPTGKFSIAEIDLKPLMAAKTPEKNIVVRPHDVISIPLAEIVYVIGDVVKVGPVTLNDGHSISLLQAVSSSGGILRTAASGNSKILRPIAGGTKWSELPVNIKKILEGKADDQTLLAGDVLFVPSSTGKRVAARVLEAAIQTGTLAATYGAVR